MDTSAMVCIFCFCLRDHLIVVVDDTVPFASAVPLNSDLAVYCHLTSLSDVELLQPILLFFISSISFFVFVVFSFFLISMYHSYLSISLTIHYSIKLIEFFFEKWALLSFCT